MRSAFSDLDRFIVWNAQTCKPVEGHFNEERAQHAAQVLNDHEERYGRPAVYTVMPKA